MSAPEGRKPIGSVAGLQDGGLARDGLSEAWCGGGEQAGQHAAHGHLWESLLLLVAKLLIARIIIFCNLHSFVFCFPSWSSGSQKQRSDSERLQGCRLH